MTCTGELLPCVDLAPAMSDPWYDASRKAAKTPAADFLKLVERCRRAR